MFSAELSIDEQCKYCQQVFSEIVLLCRGASIKFQLPQKCRPRVIQDYS